jgi:hypothetical protein
MFEDLAALLGILGTLITFVTAIRSIGPDPRPPPLKDPLTYGILVLNLIITGLLPLQLWREFPRPDLAYAPYQFYFRHYPHLTIYPILFFGLAVLFLFRAIYLWREYSPGKLRWRIVFAAALALTVTYWEVSGRQMMLLEFNKEAQTATELFSPEQISKKAKAVGLSNAFNPPLGQQVRTAVDSGLSPSEASTERMDELLNHYDAWNAVGVPWRSKSRTLYIVVFFHIMFVMFLGWSLSLFLPRTEEPPSVQHARDYKISVNLLCTFFVFLVWMPFRIFSNVNTKIPLFGPDKILDNFFGKGLPTMLGLTSADTLPVVAALTFPIILLVRIRRISRKYTIVLFGAVGILLVVGLAVVARVNREAFLNILGVDQEMKHVVFRVLFAFVVTLFIYQFVESIPKNGGNGAGKTGSS